MRACLSTWLSNSELNSLVYIPEKVLFLHWRTGTNRRDKWIPRRKGTKFHLSFSITLNERAGKLPVSDLGPIYCSTTLWTLCKSSTVPELRLQDQEAKSPKTHCAGQKCNEQRRREQKMSFPPRKLQSKSWGGGAWKSAFLLLLLLLSRTFSRNNPFSILPSFFYGTLLWVIYACALLNLPPLQNVDMCRDFRDIFRKL